MSWFVDYVKAASVGLLVIVAVWVGLELIKAKGRCEILSGLECRLSFHPDPGSRNADAMDGK